MTQEEERIARKLLNVNTRSDAVRVEGGAVFIDGFRVLGRGSVELNRRQVRYRRKRFQPAEALGLNFWRIYITQNAQGFRQLWLDGHDTTAILLSDDQTILGTIVVGGEEIPPDGVVTLDVGLRNNNLDWYVSGVVRQKQGPSFTFSQPYFLYADSQSPQLQAYAALPGELTPGPQSINDGQRIEVISMGLGYFRALVTEIGQADQDIFDGQWFEFNVASQEFVGIGDWPIIRDENFTFDTVQNYVYPGTNQPISVALVPGTNPTLTGVRNLYKWSPQGGFLTIDTFDIPPVGPPVNTGRVSLVHGSIGSGQISLLNSDSIFRGIFYNLANLEGFDSAGIPVAELSGRFTHDLDGWMYGLRSDGAAVRINPLTNQVIEIAALFDGNQYFPQRPLPDDVIGQNPFLDWKAVFWEANLPPSLLPSYPDPLV